MTMSSIDWSECAFFDPPDRDSLDGGTTSAGALWHGISPRWGHSLHTMCSYHGMFPARIVHYFIQQYSEPDVPEDIRMLYHPNTLRQICYLRDYLLRKDLAHWCQEEFMIGGALAGIMHGSHRRDGTSQYLSISMPNTFSMSPAYVKKYIAVNQLMAPDQDVFECLRDKLARLYLDAIDGPGGRVFKKDAPS